MKDIELPMPFGYMGKTQVFTAAQVQRIVEADRAQRVPDRWSPSNQELAAIYKQANGGITTEMGSITAGKVFNAMRAMLASTPAQPAQQEPSATTASGSNHHAE